MNVLHRLGGDYGPVGKNFFFKFWHGGDKNVMGRKPSCSNLMAKKKTAKFLTSIFRRGKVCRIRWNSEAERLHRLLYRWNKLRRMNTDRNKWECWLSAGRIPEDSTPDERALRAAPRRDGRHPCRTLPMESDGKWLERRRDDPHENFARADVRWE